MGRAGRGNFRRWCHPLTPLNAPHLAKKKGEGPYIKVVAVHSLVVQGDGHPDADVCFPLDRGGGDDEVLGVVPHQVHLEHAVQALGQNGEETSQKGLRRPWVWSRVALVEVEKGQGP